MSIQNDHNNDNSKPTKMTAEEFATYMQEQINNNNDNPNPIKMNAKEFASFVNQMGENSKVIIGQNHEQMGNLAPLARFFGSAQFDPKQFDGKEIDEYQLPSIYFDQTNIDSDDLFEKNNELLISTHKSSGVGVIFGLFALFPGIGVLLFGLFLTYQSFYGTNGQKFSDALVVIIFGSVWTILASFGIASLIKHSLYAYWFKITKHGFECYYGRKFDSDKAQKFSLDDKPVIYFGSTSEPVQTDSSTQSQNQPDCIDLIVKDQTKSFTFEQVSYSLAQYLKGFLDYHLGRISE